MPQKYDSDFVNKAEQDFQYFLTFRMASATNLLQKRCILTSEIGSYRILSKLNGIAVQFQRNTQSQFLQRI